MIRIGLNITCILLLILFCLDDVYAQNQKIGYIDSDIIMQNMPEYSGVEQRLSLLSDGWRQEISRLENEISDLVTDFEAREILFTDDIREQRINEIELKREQLNNFIEDKFGPNGEYFTTQKELLEPIQRTIFDALLRVASREAFDFVFDRADDIRFLYARQEWNLTDEVMLELGMDDTNN
ncbi:MAG: OmpH family outer membrane protein [Balneolaceae bacterium]